MLCISYQLRTGTYFAPPSGSSSPITVSKPTRLDDDMKILENQDELVIYRMPIFPQVLSASESAPIATDRKEVLPVFVTKLDELQCMVISLAAFRGVNQE